jgi:hypothetical protein
MVGNEHLPQPTGIDMEGNDAEVTSMKFGIRRLGARYLLVVSQPARAVMTEVRLAAYVLLWIAAIGFSPVFAVDNDSYKVAQGYGVYLGVMPSAIATDHPKTHTEGTMHGGNSPDGDEYHILIAIFDIATGARVEKSDVTANVSSLGHVGQANVVLEPMVIANTTTFGAFVRMPANGRYEIVFNIRIPQHPEPIRVSFIYEN